MIAFGDLSVGDTFNTMVARWAKKSGDMAEVVMGTVPGFEVGTCYVFRGDQEVVLIWSSNPELMKRVTIGTIE